MKFNEIKNLKQPSKYYSKKIINNDKFKLIKSIKRFDNVAVILMNPNTKGSLRILSMLVNDGKINCSWTIRVTWQQTKWVLSIVPYYDINKKNIDINLFELISNIIPNDIDITGNLHSVFINIYDTKYVEKIINNIIDLLKDKKIDGIEKFEINKEYTIENSNKYVLEYKYSVNINNNSIKNIELLNMLIKHNLQKNELHEIEKIFYKIDNKEILDKETVHYINQLVNKYCSDSERIRCAIKFMS